MTMTVDQIWPIAVGLAFAAMFVTFIVKFVKESGIRASKAGAEMTGKMEALFRATFPELQPHFHPARVHEYVVARRARKASSGPFQWKNPPGFPAAAVAEVTLDGLKDKVALLDATGQRLAEFVYEEHPEGGVIRYGKGKFTVNVKGPEPRVRYWHPKREFKWTPAMWKIQSGLAEEPLSSGSDRDDSSDSSSSSSVSRGAAAGAAAGGIIAAGGTFDGGGASAAWDDGGSSSSGGSPSSSDFSSVESGSSSTASSSSTSY